MKAEEKRLFTLQHPMNLSKDAQSLRNTRTKFQLKALLFHLCVIDLVLEEVSLSAGAP